MKNGGKMTEKRFTIKHYESTDWIYDNGEVIHTSKVVELLNELYEENEQLKQDNKELEKFRYSVFQKMNELIL